MSVTNREQLEQLYPNSIQSTPEPVSEDSALSSATSSPAEEHRTSGESAHPLPPDISHLTQLIYFAGRYPEQVRMADPPAAVEVAANGGTAEGSPRKTPTVESVGQTARGHADAEATGAVGEGLPTSQPQMQPFLPQQSMPMPSMYPFPWGQWPAGTNPQWGQQALPNQALPNPAYVQTPSLTQTVPNQVPPPPPQTSQTGPFSPWSQGWMWPQQVCGWPQATPMFQTPMPPAPVVQQQPPPVSHPLSAAATQQSQQTPPTQGFVVPSGTPDPAYMRLPSSTECGYFDGTTPAAQWLEVVRWEFHRVGVMSNTPAVCKIIEAISMLCRGTAAVFLKRSPIAKDVIQRARSGLSVPTDLPLMEKALCEQFPELPEEDAVITPLEELEALTQEATESLPAYFTRAQVLLRRMNIKDAPILDFAAQSGDACLLKSAISHFVGGLWDAELRAEAREKDADGKDTLLEAYETVKKAQQLLRKRQETQRQQAQALRVQMLESLVAASTGVPATQALMQSFPNIVLPEETSGSLDVTASSSQAVISRAPQTFDLSRPEPFWKPARAAPAPAPKIPSSYPCQALQTAHPEVPASRPQPQKTYNFADPSSLPPRETSKNPIINGREKIQPSTRACFRCGRKDHYKNQCTTPEGDCLLPWEQAWMRLLMMNRPQPVTAQPWQRGGPAAPTVAVAASAEIRQRESVPDMGSVHPDRMARMIATCAPDVDEEITSQGALCAGVGVESNSCVLSVGEDEDDTPEEELSSHVLYLSALLGEAVNRAAKKRKMGDGTGVSVESMLNPEPWRQPEQPHSGPAKAAKQPQPPTPPIPDNAPDSVPRRQKKSRAPREINGRLGEGPFDWKRLANAVEVKLSLMDLFQISPEGSAALKKMATRISAKAQAKARRMASFSKRHAKTAAVNVESNTAVAEYTTTRAWRLTPVLRYRSGGKTLTRTLPENSAQTDQGSDINIISDSAVQTLNLQRRKLTTIGVDKLFVKTSTGDSARVTEFVVLDLGVLSIWRGVWAIVRPKSLTGAHEGINILLGLPWLWDVAAFLDIRSTSLWIGDRDEGEPRVQIRGPLMVRSANHRICLESDGPVISLNPGAVVEELSVTSSGSDADEDESLEDPTSTDDVTVDEATTEDSDSGN
ncbi:hypothetical protein GGR50DRAFT_704157 [Xylaria sp. CBS 124048]|nr:hypothetical protein GGR50DRAFT_704157 [Xylaria sp. CBS 124048]